MYRIKENIFKIEQSDILNNQLGSYIEIEDYIDCVITINNKSITPVIFYHQENIETDNIYYVPEGSKFIYLNYNNEISSSSSGDIINYDNLKLIVNPVSKNKINHTFKINKTQNLQCDITPIKLFAELFKQNNNLSVDNINYREDDLYQNVDVKTPEDNSYYNIKISNIIAFNKEEDYTSEINYLPQKNKSLQKIFIKIKSDELKTKPPVAAHFQFYIKNSKTPIFQIKSKIYPGDIENYKYFEGYGFHYGVIYDESNVVVKSWSNQFGNFSDEYVFEWTFTQKQFETIINYYKNDNNISFMFKCRYAVEEINDNFIWKGWSPNINNIKINTPPSPPSQIKMLERKQI